jgi:FAD/FMN-containing dehydrogenase
MKNDTEVIRRSGFRGRLITSADADYDDARAVYNGMVDKRPRVIARCRDVADVIAAVNVARTERMLLAIRGGGHNGPGLGSCNDGLVLDVSGMRGIRVDPASRTVRVDAGCTSGDVDHATHPFGLAVPFGIVSSTGVAGLTLGGGTGYLTRKFGLTIDNLVEADVRPRRRRVRHHQRDEPSRPVLGVARGWRQLRRRDELSLPSAPSPAGIWRPGVLGGIARARGDARVSQLPAHRA